MKKLIVLLLLVTFSLNGQEPYKFSKKELRRENNWRLLGTVGGSVVLGLSNGFDLNHKQELGHPLKYVAIGMYVAGAVFGGVDTWEEFLTYGAQGAAFNFALFDRAHNLAAGLPKDYYGNTHIYDRTMNGIPYHGAVFVKTISFGFAIALNYQEYNNKIK